MTNGDNGTRIMNELFYSVSNLLNWSEFPVEERQIQEIPVSFKNAYYGTYLLVEEEDLVTLLDTKSLKIENRDQEMYMTYGGFIKSMKLFHDIEEENDDVFFTLTGHEFTLSEDKNGTKTVTFYGRKYIKTD